jgi:hypothetical protein
MGLDITGLGSIADFAGKIIDKVWPDPVAAAQAKLELVKAEQAGALAELTAQWDNAKAQAAVNQVEAASSSVFVSGARPFIMWVCGVGLAMQFLVSPMLTWGAALFGKTVVLPPLDMGTLLTLLLGLLGLGGMRTVEKIKGVAK